MRYFDNIEEGNDVFGLVYGHGKVKSLWTDGFYEFEVEYDNGQCVPYTRDGVPGWANFEYQTVFYPSDIDLMSIDISTNDDILNAKRIIKLRNKGKLEVKCPSGIWTALDKCPGSVAEGYLEAGKLHLFRKMKLINGQE